MMIFFLLFLFALQEPRFPYWNDYKATFTNKVSDWGDFWLNAGKIWYRGSKNEMRVDYYGFCEPHFKFDNYNFSCTYLFTNHTAFFITDKDCCIFRNNFNALSPDWVSKAGHYEGIEIIHGRVANVWSHNEGVPVFKWYSDYNTYEGMRFFGPNAELYGDGYLDLVYFDESSDLDDKLFEVQSSCYVKCPFPPFSNGKNNILFSGF